MEIDVRLDRVRYVTSRYPQLQGLRLIPLALLFVISACWRAGLFRLPRDQAADGPQAWFVGGLGLAVLASYVCKAWYGRHVGSVGQRYVQSAAIPIMTTCIMAGASLALQLAIGWQVSLPSAVVGTVLFVVGTRQYGYRSHYVLAASLLALDAVMPMTGVPREALGIAFDATVGAALLITGVGDHVLLVRTLRGPREAVA